MMTEEDKVLDPISPEKAREVLRPRLEALIEDGWRVLSQDSFQARLTRIDKNLVVYVDLLGEVREVESPLSPRQEHAQGIAIALTLILVMFIVVVVTWLDWVQ